MLFRRLFATLPERFSVNQQALKQELAEPLLETLAKRGLIQQNSSGSLESILNSGTQKVKLYCGADPTAISLHLGNLLPLIVLLHFNIRGHGIVGLVGGATGEVGDPSGRKTERSSIKDEVRNQNADNIRQQMHTFFQNGVNYYNYLSLSPISNGEICTRNNIDWWKDVGFLSFLSQYGKHIRVQQMLARDSVKDRLSSEAGIGFNEFTYQILQAYDFWHLFSQEKVDIQVGGNDQWGNITAGIDLISRLAGKEHKRKPFGITVPLLTTSSGAKFGKSAGNAVFIDKNITTPFDLYQFFVKTPDSDLDKLLKIFTFLPLPQIEQVLELHDKDPSARYAQRILANEVTDLIHGVGAGKVAKYVSSYLYPLPDEPFEPLPTDKLIDLFKQAGILQRVSKDEFYGQPFSRLLSAISNTSRTEAKKLINNGGLYFGTDRIKVDDDCMLLSETHLVDGKLLLLRVGKGKYYIVELY